MDVGWEFAQIVKTRRLELGLSQRDVAEKTEGAVTFAALSRIENATRATRGQSLTTVRGLAIALRMRVVIDPDGLRVERLD